MKKLILSGIVVCIAKIGCCNAFCPDLNWEIPLVTGIEKLDEHFEKVEDVAEYGGADYSNALCIARGITLVQAYEIALFNPEITYFFFIKGGQMVLNCERGNRFFHYGDAVFFKGKPWWGSAHGLADGYIKKY